MDIFAIFDNTLHLFLLPESWMIIATLFLLEGVLSLDNATVLASMVRGLSDKDQRKALAYGIAGAFGFRILALFFVQQLIALAWLKVLGGLYLLWLVFDYFVEEYKHGNIYKHAFKVVTSIGFILLVSGDTSFMLYNTQINVVVLGKIVLGLFCVYLLIQMHRSLRAKPVTDEEKHPKKHLIEKSLFWTIVSIELADLAFSIDNLFVAVGVTKHLPLIVIGVCLGIVTMRFVAKQINRLIKTYPLLDISAHIVIAFVGVKMMLSYTADIYPDSVIHAIMHSHGLELYTSTITILIFLVPVLYQKYLLRNRKLRNRRHMNKVLADGKVGVHDVGYLHNVLLVENMIDEEDLKLLFDIYYASNQKDNHPTWNDLYTQVIKTYLLRDDKQPGIIFDDEAQFLQEQFLRDGKIDDTERRVLEEIQSEHPVIFDQAFAQWMEKALVSK